MVWNRGQELFGSRYIIEAKLGEGGIGITYLAKNRRGELRVIKTLREQVLNNPVWQLQQGKLKQDFKDEALRLSLCRHPHIVEVENVFEDSDLPCMVMEYIPGEDLSERITAKGVLPEAEALLYIRQIGDALNLVHDKGLLHRDLKPNNIMIRQDQEQAVLIDFGIARQFIPGCVQQHTENLTPAYAPPEQHLPDAQRGEYIDVYALAATLYVLVTGQLPMPAPARLQNIPLTPPQNLNPRVTDRVNEAIMKGMALNYQFRPQSVQEWLDLLGEGTILKRQLVINSISHTQPTIPTFAPPSDSSCDLTLQSFRFETLSVDAQGNITHRYNLQAKYFVEDLGDGVTLEMVQIPGGTFTMGSPEEEEGRRDNESPQHQVTIQPFFMGKYVVTQGQYQAIMGENPSRFKGAKRPVERVSWDDAVRFCQCLSLRVGRNYRLPSEAEWEYATRAGTITPFYFGETITTDLVNYKGNSIYACAAQSEYRKQTTDVGTFPPNAFGLYDMHGNVWEWCQDTYHGNYNDAPTDGSAFIDNDNNYRVLRGGSWFYDSQDCRSAYRYSNLWAVRDLISILSVGFRVVCTFGRTLP